MSNSRPTLAMRAPAPRRDRVLQHAEMLGVNLTLTHAQHCGVTLNVALGHSPASGVWSSAARSAADTLAYKKADAIAT